MIGCGVIVLNVVYVDMVFKDMEVCVDVKFEVKLGFIFNVMSKMGDVVMNVLGMIGLCYCFGGNMLELGFDCSGFVCYVFNDIFGFLLLCCVVEMSCVGISVDIVELCFGDLVFFNIMCYIFLYVGIYIGDNKFVYVLFMGSKICVDDMIVLYWVMCYNGVCCIEGNFGVVIKDGVDNFVE